MRALSTGAIAFVVLASCAKDLPSDCGDPAMAIVTFQPYGSAEDDARWCVDIHAASRVDATPQNAGLDDSYAVSQPGVYPWTNVSFREASEACGRAGKFLCDYDVLKAITPTTPGLGRADFDLTTISALPQNSLDTSVPNRLDPLNPYDMVINGYTGMPPFPESTKSVAFWSTLPGKDDKDRDETAAYLIGSISGDQAIGGNIIASAVSDQENLRHPLIGFRCCILAKMKPAFEPLGRDPKLMRPTIDQGVPLAPPR